MTTFQACALSAVMLGWSAMVVRKALTSRRSGSYVYEWWDGGLMLKGKATPWKRAMAIGVGGLLLTLGADVRFFFFPIRPGGPREFSFVIPSGWLDLSQGVPSSNFDRLDPQLVELLRVSQAKVHAQAANVDNLQEEPEVPVFTAEEVFRDYEVTDSFLDQLAKDLNPNVTPEIQGKAVQLRDGLTVGRILIRTQYAGKPARALVYAVRGRRHVAVMNCMALEGSFDPCLRGYERAVDASISSVSSRRPTDRATSPSFQGFPSASP